MAIAPVCADELATPIFIKIVEILISDTPTAPGTKLIIASKVVKATSETDGRKSISTETLANAFFQPKTTTSQAAAVKIIAANIVHFSRHLPRSNSFNEMIRADGSRKIIPTPVKKRTMTAAAAR